VIPAQMHPLVLPLFLGGLVCAALAVYTWRQGTEVARAFALLMAAVAWWSFSYGCELMTTCLDQILVWLKIEYPGIASTPVFFFLFALSYSGRSRSLSRLQRAALFIIPAIVVLLVWTLPNHRLYYANWGLAVGDGYVIFDRTQGIGYWIFVYYSYLLILIGLVLLAQMLVTSLRVYRGQIAVVLGSAIVPWLANVALNPMGLLDPPVDPTPVVFALSGLLLAISLFRFRFLDLMPVARSALVETMADAWIILDEHRRIVDLNAAARRLIGRRVETPVSRTANDVFSHWPEMLPLLNVLEEGRTEIGSVDSQQRHLEMHRTLLRDAGGRLTGRLIVLRDITEQKRLERRQQQLIAELQDALNQIRTLTGLLPICAHCHKIRDDGGYWHRVEEYIERHSEAQFTHGICPDCLREIYPRGFERCEDGSGCQTEVAPTELGGAQGASTDVRPPHALS
jgi:PAS domain S-box-containing protein